MYKKRKSTKSTTNRHTKTITSIKQRANKNNEERAENRKNVKIDTLEEIIIKKKFLHIPCLRHHT